MGQQKYTNNDLIWRNGVAYPATSRNLRRSRKSFLKEQGHIGSYRHRRSRRTSKADKEAINSAIRGILFMLVFFVCGLVVLTWIIFLCLLFSVEYLVKSLVLSLIKIKKEKTKIFKINKFERKLSELMKNSVVWMSKFHPPKK